MNYEFGTVSTASLFAMGFTAALALLIVALLFLVGKYKFKAKTSSFIIGCFVFFAMALVLEKMVHAIVLGNAQMNELMQNNIWIYAIYGGLCAAFFEEVGRYFAMKKIMKGSLDFKNAFMYGCGHGGCEAVMILTVSNITNLAMALSINNGKVASYFEGLDQEKSDLLFEQLSALWTTSTGMFYLAIIERVFAIVLQIAMSILMYQCIKLGKKSYFALVFAIHFFMDFASVVIAHYAPIFVAEIFIAIFAILMLFLARSLEKKTWG